ncbi:MAG: N-acetyltransferase [Lactobacillaceae bacterium]|jgi:predicted GNAT family acetyltransferase|nr:N-acetyltransferase [Lactobacillaceae bacterium]
MKYDVKQESERSRFVVDVDGMISTLNYDLKNGRMLFLSTHVHPDLEGRGIASALTAEALKYAIDNKYEIVPLCAFTKAYLLRHEGTYGKI